MNSFLECIRNYHVKNFLLILHSISQELISFSDCWNINDQYLIIDEHQRDKRIQNHFIQHFQNCF